jgi:transglutaminase-like putative cysteine protease
MIAPDRATTFWVIATFSLAMLPQLLRMPLPVAAMTLAPLLWRISAELRGWQPLPALLRHAATGLALVVLFVSYGDLSGRRSAVSLLALMLALKLIEGYRIRDARLVVCFSLFLCATQFLFGQGIAMPLYGGATVILALVALTRLQRNEAWSHTDGRAPAVRASLLSELGFGVRLLAVAVPVGLAFFLLFPRLSSPLWGIPETTLDSKSGLSDSMSPGSIQQLFMDDSPAFRVTFEGAAPAAEELYWRGPVFWRFDGRSWKSSFYGSNIEAVDRPGVAGAPWSYTVQLEPNERNWLFALDYPATTPPDTRLTLDYQLIHRDPVIQLMRYAMVSNPDFTDAPQLPDTLRQQALELPDNANPRTRELVGRWRRETPGDAAFARRVLDHFNREDFHYSLDAPLLGRHPVDEFLFDSRTGFCEHYASSFAVMMRMAGIPARVVTGYLGGWYNALGDYYLVRQSDAHAWTEIWLADGGWSRVDPTAAVSPLRIQQGSLGALSEPRHMLDYSWLRGMRNSVDIVQQRWNDWVIEYGARQQARLFARFGLEHATPAQLVGLLFAALAAFGAILFPLALRIRGPARREPAQKAWHTFLRRLDRVGVASRASSGPIELAGVAAARLPGSAPSIHRIAHLYTLCRYAPGDPPVSELRRAVKAFRPVREAG